nr:coiled-coil domain-containing protein 87 [Paramormyrops kingsleyae]
MRRSSPASCGLGGVEESQSRHVRRMDLQALSSYDRQQWYYSILGQLTLHEGETDRTVEVHPVSSVLEDHRLAPTSLSDLQSMLEEWMQNQCVVHSVSQDDQQALTATMMSQLRLVCHDLSGVNHDPSLSQEDNQQLQSDIFSEILRVCERLCLHYIHLRDVLRKRGVFGDQANRSRLCAQMTLDCAKFLNIQTIRRSVTAEIKAAWKVKPSSGQQGAPESLDRKGRKSGFENQQKASIERDLQEIEEEIGELNLECVYDLIPCHLEETTHRKQYTADSCAGGAARGGAVCTPSGSPIRLRGCQSMPELEQGSLLEELGLEPPPSRAPSPVVLLGLEPSSCREKEPISAAEDLRRLVQDIGSVGEPKMTDPEIDLEMDLPALISALPRSGSSKLHLLRQTLQKFTEEEEDHGTAKSAVMEEPLHPQPVAVSVSLTPKSIARTAPPRVSDRVFTETVKLHMYPPVYSHLTGEIEPSSVKWLDRNLNPRREITEVYRELSKTVSNHYLNFDESDPVIEPAVEDGGDMWMPPRKNSQRSFNPELERSGINHPAYRKTEVLVQHKKPHKVTSGTNDSRQHWSKSHLSVDDYMKYISNQRLDYLGEVFHLHDSDDSDEEENRKRKALAQHEEKKSVNGSLLLFLLDIICGACPVYFQHHRRQSQKIDSQKRIKEEFAAGVWNVNSGLLGGLGNESLPNEVDSQDEDTSSSFTQRAQERQSPGKEPFVAVSEDDQLQVCLERIWKALSFPSSQRLEMAIKYSSPSYQSRLKEAITAWERTAKLIQQRETLLAQLEMFERGASDPSRFFQHGYRGTSIARMDESRRRQKINRQISALERILSEDIRLIRDRFCDTVTYNVSMSSTIILTPVEKWRLA